MAANQPWINTGYFANLTNGVSQQPPRVRLESQQDAVENMFPTVFQQMGPRPPLEIVSELEDLDMWLDIETNGYPFTHEYVRDASEAYKIFFDGAGDLKVFDRATGAEKTVSIDSMDNYLNSTDPEKGFHCFTYKDVTFVTNREITVAMDAATSTTRTAEGLIRIKDYVSGATYSVTVNFGATPVTVAPTGADVNAVAADLVTKLTAHGSWPGTATAVRYGNVVHVSHSTLTSVNVSDNRAGTAIQGFTDKVLKVGDLTPYGPNGYIVQVTGTSSTASAQDANTSDDQYYKFEADNGTSGSGTWVETVAPGITYAIDPETAPHTLTRNGDGTFTFDVIDWGDREVGDALTNPVPPFIGQTIWSIFQLGNRLGFICGNQFSLSRVGEESWFEFFRSTTSAQLDDDPVYGPIPSSQVNKVFYAVGWNGELLTMGDLADGAVSYGSKLALSNLNITTPTATNISKYVPPILSGSDLLFIVENGDYSNIGSYELDDFGKKLAESITDTYLGRYIPKNVKRFVGRARDFVAILSTEERQKLYVMTYSKKEQRLVQRAVFTWNFDNVPDMDILDISCDGAYLYVTYGGPNGKYYMGRMDVSAGASDPGYPRKCYLDHRMSDTGVYDAMTNKTTFTLPYALTDGDKRAAIATIADGETRYALGEALTIASSTDTTLVFNGDLSDADLTIFAGYGITRYFIPNPIYNRSANPNGPGLVDMMSDVNIQRIAIGYFNTQHFKAELISKATSAVISSREYIGGLQLDDIHAKLDDNGVTYTGELLLSGEGADANDTYLKISTTSHLPFYIDMIQWIASEYSAKV